MLHGIITTVDNNLIRDNVLGARAAALSLGGTGNVVVENFIGTDRTGTIDFSSGNGVVVQDDATATIGDASGTQGNTIAFNSTAIRVAESGLVLDKEASRASRPGGR